MLGGMEGVGDQGEGVMGGERKAGEVGIAD